MHTHCHFKTSERIYTLYMVEHQPHVHVHGDSNLPAHGSSALKLADCRERFPLTLCFALTCYMYMYICTCTVHMFYIHVS